MLLFVEIILLIIALILLIPCTVLGIECSLASLFAAKEKKPQGERPEKITVLIPAHNEAAVIASTIETIKPQLKEQDRIVVVADNCTDDTAAIALSLGTTVLNREDTEKKGKGYALDYGLEFIKKEPPDLLICFDADCFVSEGTIEQIAGQAHATNRPVQATYLIEQPENPTAKDVISALALLVKNFVRPSGLAVLGLPCVLTGTGMAFPWAAINKISLASGNIVEDMQLGIDLVAAGYPPLFCASGQVISKLPQEETSAKNQRKRWEHGHLQTLMTQVPQMLKAAISNKNLNLFFMALEVAVPPLSLLVMIWLAATVITFLLTFFGVSWLIFWLYAIEGIIIIFSIVIAWARYGRDKVPLLTLLTVPFYVLWKIPLYFAFLFKPQTQWNKTSREIERQVE